MNPVSSTALWMAAARAKESTRADRLFTDPYAAALAGISAQGVSSAGGDISYISIRTRYFDDALQQAISTTGLRQLVIVGAGLDTRAFRLSWPSDLSIYELDHAEVFAHKEPILRSAGATTACRRITLPIDFSQPWTDDLRRAGYVKDAPAAFLVEGVLMYLAPAAATDCLQTLAALAHPGSLLLADMVSTDMLTSPHTRDLMADLARRGCPWQFGVADPAQLLAQQGWTASVVSPGEPEANYGRWPHRVAPRHIPGVPRMYLVSAHRV